MASATKSLGGEQNHQKITCKRGPDGVITECTQGESQEEMIARVQKESESKSKIDVTVREEISEGRKASITREVLQQEIQKAKSLGGGLSADSVKRIYLQPTPTFNMFGQTGAVSGGDDSHMSEGEFRGEVAQLVRKQIRQETERAAAEVRRAEGAAGGSTGGIIDQVSQILADHESQEQVKEVNRARIESAIGLQVARDGVDLARAQTALKDGLRGAEFANAVPLKIG
jgi:hypothetical protein